MQSADSKLGYVAGELASPSRPFVAGVDTLRLFAAVFVVFYHGAAPPLAELVPASVKVQADMLSRLPFNGSAAVALFFVISGFCIHLGNVGRGAVDPMRFLAQRALRIVPALLAVVVITSLLGEAYRAAVNTVLWSVYCELIYYALYPFAFPLLNSRRLPLTLALSVAVSLGLAVWRPDAKFLWEFVVLLTWLFCLPMWLLGCMLADLYRRNSGLRTFNIWLLRIAAVGLGSLATILAYVPSLSIGYIWTIPIFAAFCCVWIFSEIRAAEAGRLVVLFEVLGLASYSIYLVHKPAMEAVVALDLPWFVAWPAKLAAVAAVSAAFYFVVERPSHHLSRWVGRVMKKPTPTVAAAV